LERRYGREALQALDRLRETKAKSGAISPADIDRIAVEVGIPRAHLNATASFYADLGFAPRGRRHVQVCCGTACFAATGGEHVGDAAEALGAAPGGRSAGGEVSVQPVYCLGYCYAGPAALDGERPCAGSNLVDQLRGHGECRNPEVPFSCACSQPVVLEGLVGNGADPWVVWRNVLAGDRGEVLKRVLDSGLRGRGGAGFPVGRKWEAAAASQTAGPRYVICNGDEGDPGSYVDRLLMESDPHRALAGMGLAALATGAERAYMYVRSEYPRARDRLRRAVAEARDAGHLGTDIGGSGVDFDIEVFEGAGSYVAGEETSLMHSVEGLRGEVAVRPPYPTDRGLFHLPTAVNNVESLSAVPWIVAHGGEAYARLGVNGSRGTKVVCLNERFRHPGAYEVEFGVSLRWIVEELGGGLVDGHRLRALQVGGPLGGFLAADQLDVPLTFEALREAGVELGHGSLIAIDERTSPTALLRHVWRFAASESCGTCVPCRIGTRRGLEMAEALAAGAVPPPSHRDALLDTMHRGSLCAFGKSVPEAVRSLMRAYPEELGTP
jgi:NADH:ubiquinone oxidoreductase subunit F (NADH-binding)/NADH:ubiquinone oxidoreductase subunit E